MLAVPGHGHELAIVRHDLQADQKDLAAHVLGFTNIDGRGGAGVERAFDSYLSDPQTRGQPLVLSISSKVQQALEAELGDAMQHFSAIGAAGVVMDVHTGEVLAMTSLPNFNPNAPGQGTPDQMFNRATLGVFELGSTFKPFTLAMAMDSGVVSGPAQIMNCPEVLPAYRACVASIGNPINPEFRIVAVQ